MMDELTELMSESGAIGNSLDSSKQVNYRSHQYKAKSGLDQRKRRDKLLNLQKRNRDDVVNQLRQINDDDWQVFSSDALHGQSDDAMDVQEGKYRNRRKNVERDLYKDRLMLSEWMIDMPADFETNWVMIPSPVGKRCLIVANGGTTYMYLKSGYCINKFPSKLPGGCYNKSIHGGKRGITLLDCIFDEVAKTYYVLDLMCWNGQAIIDSDTDFRYFWAESQLQECPEVQNFSRINPFKFHHLPSFACRKDSLEKAMLEDFHFKVDGLLFYHRQAHYLCGSTPLVVWLKPYMLPEVLGIDINERYKEEKPSSYSGFQNHLSLVQTNTTVAQKHQDLYESSDGQRSKADRLIEHHFKTRGTEPIVKESLFKYAPSAVRDAQLGIETSSNGTAAADDSNSKSEAADRTGFKFGQAPILNPNNQMSASSGTGASGFPSQDVTNAAENTAMEADVPASMTKSSPISGACAMSMVSEQATPNNAPPSSQPSNQWTQFR